MRRRHLARRILALGLDAGARTVHIAIENQKVFVAVIMFSSVRKCANSAIIIETITCEKIARAISCLGAQRHHRRLMQPRKQARFLFWKWWCLSRH